MTIQEAIKFIVNKRDKSLLTDSKKFKAHLKDLCPECQKELKILNRTLDENILAKIFGNEKDNVKIARLRDEFEDQGLSETWSDFIISSFAQVLGWNYSNNISSLNNSIQPNCEEGNLTKEILQQLDINYAQKTSINIPEICVYNEAQQNGNSTDYKVKYIKITGIGDGAFQNCSSLQSITLPKSVTTIGDNAFNGCSSLTNINIPEGVTTIGNSAFQSCNKLQSITLPNSLTKIGDSIFYYCTSLKSITIPNKVKSIGSIIMNGRSFIIGVFQNCSSLTTINIPEGVKTIGDNTFNGCSSLKEITIPDSVKNIGVNAFNTGIYNNNNRNNIYSGLFSYNNAPSNDTTVYYDGNATGSPWGAGKHVTIKEKIASANSKLQETFKTLEEIDKRYPNENQLATKARNNKQIADQVSIMTSLLEKGLEFTKKFKI